MNGGQNIASLTCLMMASTLPFHLFAYVPFWNSLRLPKKTTFWLLIATQALFMGIFFTLYQAGLSLELAQLPAIPLYGGLFFYFVKMDAGKVAFLYIFTADYLMLVKGTAAFLGGQYLSLSGRQLAVRCCDPAHFFRHNAFNAALYQADSPHHFSNRSAGYLENRLDGTLIHQHHCPPVYLSGRDRIAAYPCHTYPSDDLHVSHLPQSRTFHPAITAADNRRRTQPQHERAD